MSSNKINPPNIWHKSSGGKLKKKFIIITYLDKKLLEIIMKMDHFIYSRLVNF